jgi:transcriptional regulator GlxA family with amidase domain
LNAKMLALILLPSFAFSGHAALAEGPAAKQPLRKVVKTAIVLTEGATMIDFAGPWEVFQDTHVTELGSDMDDQMPFRLYTVGASREPIKTSGGMTVVPDYSFADAPPADLVVVGAQRGAPELKAWLLAQYARGATLVSVCTGAFKLAATGLLDGKEATTHHDFYTPFRENFPKVKLVESKRFVESGERLYTAGGLSAGIDMALHIVELFYGHEAAQRTAVYMEYEGQGWKSPAAGSAAP